MVDRPLNLLNQLHTKNFLGLKNKPHILIEAAELFSSNYGVWSKDALEKMGKYAKTGEFFNSVTVAYSINAENLSGSRIHLNKKGLREDHLPDGATSFYIRGIR